MSLHLPDTTAISTVNNNPSTIRNGNHVLKSANDDVSKEENDRPELVVEGKGRRTAGNG
ncbi:hypothetical protein A2U01_0058309 [Trifolium medium]|uniref:Uncharacterized protein n=1 Tax=Trifolium medium TaxID=97028 RepID=A0A392RNF1_9FABA|nr:hypothetical protein [Trifolium medium]